MHGGAGVPRPEAHQGQGQLALTPALGNPWGLLFCPMELHGVAVIAAQSVASSSLCWGVLVLPLDEDPSDSDLSPLDRVRPADTGLVFVCPVVPNAKLNFLSKIEALLPLWPKLAARSDCCSQECCKTTHRRAWP